MQDASLMVDMCQSLDILCMNVPPGESVFVNGNDNDGQLSIVSG
jgi:hypothetical protein